MWESASTEVSEKDGELFDGFDLGLWIAFPFVVFPRLLFFDKEYECCSFSS